MAYQPPPFAASLPSQSGYNVTKNYHASAIGATIDPLTSKLSEPFVVAVTGSGRGIGAAIAKSYAQAGVSGVFLTSRTEAELRSVADEIRAINARTRVEWLVGDTTNEEFLATMVTKIKTTFGRLDVAVVNAGTISTMLKEEDGIRNRFPSGLLEDTTDDFLRVWNLNFTSAWLAARAFLPMLRGSKDGAQALIFSASLAAHLFDTHLCPVSYNLSKFAVTRLAELAHEAYKDDGVVSYALHPGCIATPLTKDYPEIWNDILIDNISLPGGFCVWLTKEKRAWLSGRFLSANWDVDELLTARSEIEAGDKFKFRMVV